MDENLDAVIRQILSCHRHLMTEAERRADRDFYFREKIQAGTDAATVAQMTASVEEALNEPSVARLFNKGRECFLRDMARRIVAEHASALPRCTACGAVLKTPSPKTCFDCDYQSPATEGPKP